MEAYIFDAIRSPNGRGSAEKGSLAGVKPIELLNQLYTALETRNDLNSRDLDSIILGCVGQFGDQGTNIARVSSVYHGWDDQIDGITVNTFCSSGLTAIGLANAKIVSGMNDMVVAGGIEMLSRVPMFADKGAWFADPDVMMATNFTHMGVSADLIASIEGFSKESLDQYAVDTHLRAANATAKGYFNSALIPITDQDGNILLDKDECIRGRSNMEWQEKQNPVFGTFTMPNIKEKISKLYPQINKLEHFHHIGSSPQMADGASLLLIGTLEKGISMGLKPRAKIKTYNSTACEPLIMLLGGQYSAKNAIKQAGLNIEDIDLHNFAEAFSSTCLKYLKDMKLDPDRFNVNGSTMTLGHAQGASGAVISTNLLNELERRDKQFGLAAISGGAGLGAAMVIERVN